MGTRGVKNAPVHLKVLRGDRESRINRDEPLPAESRITPPDEMTAAGREIWEDLAPDLMDKGCLTSWDVYAFEAFCEAVAQYRECRTLLHKSVSKFGKFVELGAAGGQIKSPYHQMMRDCIETMAKLGSRFGLTPADRTNLRMDQADTGPHLGAERLLS
jgi:P27 family predicted phage terminase small subunit